MRVYGFKENEQGIEQGIMEVENTLKALQEFVGGYIEVYPIGGDLLVVLNEEGKFNGMKPVAAYMEDEDKIVDIFYGNVLVCRSKNEEFTDIKDSDIEVIKSKIKKIIAMFGSKAQKNPQTN